MPHIAQHEAAELWELCRDHAVAASKLQVMAAWCQDPQLRSTVQRHAQDMQQAAQRLYQMLQEPGHPYGATWQATASPPWQPAPGQLTGQAPAGQAWWQASTVPAAGGASGTDLMVAGDCLRMCKTFAVQCIWGATESAQPVRGYLYQLAGQHLQMAEEHYRWLERHGVYASPRVDAATLAEYTGKAQQIMATGQAVAQPFAGTGTQAGQAGGQGGGGYQGPYATGYSPYSPAYASAEEQGPVARREEGELY